VNPAAETSWIVRAQGLTKMRRDKERTFTVHVPKLCLGPKSRVALVGESGSGKSTILSMLALATDPDQADHFFVEGFDIISGWTQGVQGGTARLSALRAQSIAYLPQRDGLLEFLTVRQNINCWAEIAGALPVRDIHQIMDSLRLRELLDSHPASLSGGQRQRAAVACALARRPSLILADEPTAALDAVNAQRVMQALCDLGHRIGAALVLATHQVHLVEAFGFTPLVGVISDKEGTHHSVFETAS
jgi:putative ABC transport system ATP-binding protein